MLKIQFGALPERLREKIAMEPNSGCWLWTAHLNDDGYGTYQVSSRKNSRAHQVVYELTRGPVPDGLELDHTCRTRCCVNPLHLEAVTHAENIRRGDLNQNVRKTHCPQGHPLQQKGTRRHCPVCQRRWTAEWRKRRHLT